MDKHKQRNGRIAPLLICPQCKSVFRFNSFQFGSYCSQSCQEFVNSVIEKTKKEKPPMWD